MTNIYLSPSKQPANTYIVGNTNEKAQMEAVAGLVRQCLERDYECTAHMATLTLGVAKSERPAEAKNKNCGVYIALHSNAAGSAGKATTAAGAIGFYHPLSDTSKALAKAIADELDRVCPIPSNRSQNIASGMAPFDGQGYGEVRSPWQLGIVPTLIEINFHDNPRTAQYILDNHGKIAQAIADGTAKALGLLPRQASAAPAAAEVRVLCGGEEDARNVAQAMTLLGYESQVCQNV